MPETKNLNTKNYTKPLRNPFTPTG